MNEFFLMVKDHTLDFMCKLHMREFSTKETSSNKLEITPFLFRTLKYTFFVIISQFSIQLFQYKKKIPHG